MIGVRNLHIEVDAQYIKGMLNHPDLQPSSAMNRWIQGILLYDFKLIHVPATHFKGPDALSRRPPSNNESVVEYDDSWLDDIALFMEIDRPELLEQFDFHHPTQLPYSIYLLPSNQERMS